MPKLQQTLLISTVALLFLLLISLCAAARTTPAEYAKSLQQYAADQEVEKANFEENNMEEECGGVGEDECLMRRTLVAHTDYMYTKDKND